MECFPSFFKRSRSKKTESPDTVPLLKSNNNLSPASKWPSTEHLMLDTTQTANALVAPTTRLIDAVKRNSLDDVENFLKAGDDIDEVGVHSEPALFYAIRRSTPDSIGMVKYLLECGASVCQKHFSKTALIDAVQRNQTHCIPILLKYSKNCINLKVGPNSYTALHYAVSYNRYIAAYLICQDSNIDFEALDKNGLPACKIGHYKGFCNIEAKAVVETFSNRNLSYGECVENLERLGVNTSELQRVEEESRKYDMPISSNRAESVTAASRKRRTFSPNNPQDIQYEQDWTLIANLKSSIKCFI